MVGGPVAGRVTVEIDAVGGPEKVTFPVAVRMPGLAPGAIFPPELTVTAPATVPNPPRVPAVLTVVGAVQLCRRGR